MTYTWTDNPMQSGVSTCDTDIVNDNLMYLKDKSDSYNSSITTLTSTVGTHSSDISGLQSTTSSLTTDKADKNYPMTVLASSGTINLSDNSVNRITPSGTVTFELPTVSDHTKFHQIMVQIILNSVVTINVGTSYFFNKTAPELSETGKFDLVYEHNGTNWVCGCVPTGENV